MSVLHLATSDLFGGAARSAFRLHQGLRAEGFDSSMLVARRASTDASVSEFVTSRNFVRRAMRRLQRWRIEREIAAYDSTRPQGFEPFHPERSRFAHEFANLKIHADILNLHWVSEFVDYAALAGIAGETPVVWTLHDMNTVTGGCHYDHGCGRYMARCGACPQLGSAAETDASRSVWLRKQRVFSQIAQSRLHFVTPSRWLKSVIQASPLTSRFSVSVIPYGLDTEVFRPMDKEYARKALGLPLDARVILFVAHSSDIHRKGFDLLARALAELQGVDNVTLLTVGEGDAASGLNFPEKRLGRVEDDSQLALAYAAADVFVIPSREDNLPNTVLESISCGTPVVGFAAGGIPEMVRDGLTGRLAAAGDVRALRDGIADILLHPDHRRQMSAECRSVAESEYSLSLQARRYQELYASMLAPSESKVPETVQASCCL